MLFHQLEEENNKNRKKKIEKTTFLKIKDLKAPYKLMILQKEHKDLNNHMAHNNKGHFIDHSKDHMVHNKIIVI